MPCPGQVTGQSSAPVHHKALRGHASEFFVAGN
jgi:hypothetical protein